MISHPASPGSRGRFGALSGIDPASLAIGSLVIGAVSTGLQMAGQAKAARAQESQYAYQAQVAKNNALIAQQNKQYATEKGEVDATAQGLKNRQEMGALAAAQAASGVDVNTGSPVSVRASAQELAQLDALTIRSNALREAYGYDVQKSNLENEAKNLKRGIAAEASALPITQFGSLLSGASSLGSKYLDWQKVGGPLGGSSTPKTVVSS